jgi:transposase-like protein
MTISLARHQLRPGLCRSNSRAVWSCVSLAGMSNSFNSLPEVIRLVMMMYARYPLSLRNVEDLWAEREIDISLETVRFWRNLFGPIFSAEIRKRRVQRMHDHLSGGGTWMKS